MRKGSERSGSRGACQTESGQEQVLAAGWSMQETCARPIMQPDRRKSRVGYRRKSAFIMLILSVPESAGGGSAVRAQVQEPKRLGICKFQLSPVGTDDRRNLMKVSYLKMRILMTVSWLF